MCSTINRISRIERQSRYNPLDPVGRPTRAAPNQSRRPSAYPSFSPSADRPLLIAAPSARLHGSMSVSGCQSSPVHDCCVCHPISRAAASSHRVMLRLATASDKAFHTNRTKKAVTRQTSHFLQIPIGFVPATFSRSCPAGWPAGREWSGPAGHADPGRRKASRAGPGRSFLGGCRAAGARRAA